LTTASKRLARIDNVGDPLAKVNEVIDWEQLRELIGFFGEGTSKKGLTDTDGAGDD